MKKIVLSIFALLLWTTAAFASNPYSTITGNIEGANGVKQTRVYFAIPTIQSFGGSTIYPTSFSVLTDSNGDLPPNVNLPYGAFVNVSIGNGQPKQIQIPTQDTADLWTLIAANTDPPSIVAAIASGSPNCTIINPPNGSIGTATITCTLNLHGDVTTSVITPGLATVVGFQNIPISSTPPSNGQTWVYDSGTNQWVPHDPVSPSGDITVHTITPGLLDGTDTIGCFNGSRCGEKNVKDFNPAASTAKATGCNAVAGSPTVTCSALDAGFPTSTAPGKFVAVLKAGNAPTALAPTLTVLPTSTTAAYGGTNSTTYHNGCAVINGKAWGTSGNGFMYVSDSYLYEVGDTVTVDGHAYTIGSITHNGAIVFVSPNLLTTFAASAITGSNCATSRRYMAAFVQGDGGIGPNSTIVTNAASASALNPQNFNQVFAPWDASAACLRVCSCKGASCTPILVGADCKVDVYNQENLTGGDQVLNDPLLAFTASTRTTPVNAVWHDFGATQSAGTVDILDAVTCNDNQPATLIGAKIVSITGSGPYVITLDTPAISNATNTILEFDDTPAFVAAATAAQDSGGNYTTLYVPEGDYRLAQTWTVPPGQGFRLRGDGGLQTGLNSVRAPRTQLIWSGRAYGGVAVNLDNLSYPDWEGVAVTSFFGSVMGITLNIDGSNPSGPLATHGRFASSYFGVAAYTVLLANHNTSNVEFYDFANDVVGCSGTEGADSDYGFYINSINSHGHAIHGIGGDTCGKIGLVNMYGSMHLYEAHFPTMGGIGVWGSPYTSTASRWETSRNEHLQRALYLPVAGGNGGQRWDLTTDDFEDIQFTPDCAFIAAGNAGSKLSHNSFRSVGSQFVSPAATCPSGFTNGGNNALSFLASDSNLYDQTASPFGGWTTSHITSSADYYIDPATLTFTPVVVTQSYALYKCDSTCGYTINNTRNSWQCAHCEINTNCASQSFPTVTSGGDNFHGRLSVEANGQAIGNFILNYSSSGGSGNVIFDRSTTDPSINQGFSATCGNPNTLNVCYNSGTSSVVVENCSSFSSPTPLNIFTAAGSM